MGRTVRASRRALLFGLVVLACASLGRAAGIAATTAARLPADREATGAALALRTITATQLQAAKTRMPDAYLFAVSTAITPGDIAARSAALSYVIGSFASPRDDIHFISVRYDYRQGKMLGSSVTVDSFVHVVCNSGAPPPAALHCGAPTNQPEPHRLHLPITHWTTDLDGILQILAKSGYRSANYSTLTIATVARLKDVSAHRVLAALPKDRTVCAVLEAQNRNPHFAYIDVTTGALIATGAYIVPPRPV